MLSSSLAEYLDVKQSASTALAEAFLDAECKVEPAQRVPREYLQVATK
jgi:hypothetical protein